MQRMDSRFAWDDLVLPPSEIATLRAIAARLRTAIDGRRGPGISALFVGPPGTGTAMAAQVLAGDLNLALYRIDLSSLVSKYIGETEKKLRGVFEAAERGGAILQPLLYAQAAETLLGHSVESGRLFFGGGRRHAAPELF